ncbi:hypothetical protein SK128_000295, partial [Halocaridina rubra]
MKQYIYREHLNNTTTTLYIQKVTAAYPKDNTQFKGHTEILDDLSLPIYQLFCH